jgi:uncharacterized membrane protein YjdF
MESKLKILMVSFVWIVIFAVLRYSSGFIKDLIFSLVILVILYFIYQKCKLTSITYSLVSLSLFIHNLGAFGFYSNPPLGIPYDYVTHFLGIFTVTLLIANVLSSKLKKHDIVLDFIVFLIIFLAGLGIGSIVETMEFTGLLIWGEGEGFFQFGAGDYEGLNNQDTLQKIVGGGYFDTMEDLIVNSLGALSAVILFSVAFFKFGKHKI